MKIWEVNCSFTVYVASEEEPSTEACERAAKNELAEGGGAVNAVDSVREVADEASVNIEWLNSLPWGAHQGRTVAQILRERKA